MVWIQVVFKSNWCQAFEFTWKCLINRDWIMTPILFVVFCWPLNNRFNDDSLCNLSKAESFSSSSDEFQNSSWIEKNWISKFLFYIYSRILGKYKASVTIKISAISFKSASVQNPFRFLKLLNSYWRSDSVQASSLITRTLDLNCNNFNFKLTAG